MREQGISIPYRGYIDANLIIPGLPWYNEDVLFLVILDHKYVEGVPVQLGNLVTDHSVVTVISEELQHAGETWKQIHLSTVLSKRSTAESPSIPKYVLKGVKGKIRTTQKVVIL